MSNTGDSQGFHGDIQTLRRELKIRRAADETLPWVFDISSKSKQKLRSKLRSKIVKISCQLRPWSGIQISFTVVISFVLTWWIINEFEKTVDKTLVCDHSNKSYSAVLSCGTFYNVVWSFPNFSDWIKSLRFKWSLIRKCSCGLLYFLFVATNNENIHLPLFAPCSYVAFLAQSHAHKYRLYFHAWLSLTWSLWQ